MSTETPSTPKYLTGDKAGIKEFLDKFDVFLFDCDGVLWSGEQLFPQTVETITYLRTLNKQLIFVTNNSTKSRQDYQSKLSQLGIAASTEEIFGSAYAAAIYIARILPLAAHRRKVFVLGESGIEAELRSENVAYIGGADPGLRRDVQASDYTRLAARDPSLLDPEVGVVLVGLDFHVNYLKLALAYHYLTGPNQAVFLATNTDSSLPSAGALFPGAGSIAAPLVRMLGGREPLALGKPGPAMMEAVEGKFRLERGRTCMVGDRVDTDILFGLNAGLGGTLAVLTGVSGREEVVNGEVRPAAYVERLSDLLGGRD